jgi:two-component system, NarL family, response regulator DevR
VGALRAVVASADPELRARIVAVLNEAGAQVVREASDGELAVLACTTEEVDVAFLDEDLPKMSGSSVAHVLGDMDRTVRTVVVHHGAPPSGRGAAIDASGPDFEESVLRALDRETSASGDRIRIVVVDDHEMVRRGIRDLANEEVDIDVVGEATTVQEALDVIDRLRPDVTLLDVRLPDGDGIELCREIRSRHPEIASLMFSAHDDEDAMLRSIMAGASGFLLKLSAGEQLADAIRSVAQGNSLIGPGATQSVMEHVRRSSARAEMQLSGQQEKVLDLIVEGLTNREIGERLNLAEKTVKNYVSVILDKLQVRSRTQAAVYGAKRRRPSDER